MLAVIKRIEIILQQLAEQAQALDNTNKFSKAHKIIQENDLFAETLFSSHSDLYLPYVQETLHRTAELNRLIKANKKALAHARLQQIEQQISALHTALNSNSSLHKEAEQRLVAIKARQYKKAVKSIMQSSHSLHQKLNETFEFERRLLSMIEERERQRTNTKSQKNQRLSEEVLALHQRLGRCRQAISKLEREIALFK